MAAEEDKKKTFKSSDVANAKNWEQRVLNEMESPHMWNKTWSPLFESDVPFEYDAKLKYLQNELLKFDAKKLQRPVKVFYIKICVY
jgi:hypothetical protein